MIQRLRQKKFAQKIPEAVECLSSEGSTSDTKFENMTLKRKNFRFLKAHKKPKSYEIINTKRY